MKTTLRLFLCLTVGCSLAPAAFAATKVQKVQQITPAVAEDFKGASPTDDFVLGAMGGLGVIDSTGGFALMGSVSKKIVDRGFVPEINDQVFIEAELGPMFSSGSTAFVYSGHLRWDFHKDDVFTPYAIGGLAGNITDVALGSHWEMFPRFGVGCFWRVSPLITLRGEISHELMIVGASFAVQ